MTVIVKFDVISSYSKAVVVCEEHMWLRFDGVAYAFVDIAIELQEGTYILFQ